MGLKKMAGVARFELTNARIKTWCLTAWLYPNAIPLPCVAKKMVSPEGFEPPARGLEGRCSIQLSYEPIFKKNGAEDEIRTRDPRLGKAMLYP